MKDAAPRIARAGPLGSLAHNVVEFCRVLNGHGIPVAAGDAMVAVRAVAEIELSRRREFRSALRISLLRRPEDIPLFNDVFRAYWRAADERADDAPSDASVPRARTTAPPAPGGDEDKRADPSGGDTATAPPADADSGERGAAARVGTHARRLAGPATPHDAGELDRIGRALARELAERRSRRLERHPRGRRLDGRGVMQRSLRYGGVPVELRWRRPRIARAELVLVCDVSRSMAPHARLLLQFAAAVLRRAWRVEVFLFASELRRASSAWLESDWDALTGAFAGVGGGTLIGGALTTLLEDYAYCLRGNRATVVILSDGLDAGDPAVLDCALARIRRRSRRIVWMNPLLATAGYEPIARGMAAALPHLDVFTRADGIAAFWTLVRILRGTA